MQSVQGLCVGCRGGAVQGGDWQIAEWERGWSSSDSTVKLRTEVTRGAGSPVAALAMVFKLVESARARWRAITGAHLVSLVRVGARFENGVLVEREEQAA